VRPKKWIMNNLSLKILTLILAVGTWFYINNELTKIRIEEEKAIFSMLHYDVISKKLPIQVTIVGKTLPGYEIKTEGIKVVPNTCVVIGPENVLKTVDIARTVPVDISEYTQDIRKELMLAPIASGLELKDYSVKVEIPIIATDDAKKAKRKK